MASPVVESLCCVPTRPDLSQQIFSTLGTSQYNAVCLVASMFGMGGAIYQVRNLLIFHSNDDAKLRFTSSFIIVTCCPSFQLRVLKAWNRPSNSAYYRRVQNFQTSGHSIVWWLAVADLCAAAGDALGNIFL